MKFLRRESERGEFNKEEGRSLPKAASAPSKRSMSGGMPGIADSPHRSPEPSLVARGGAASVNSTPGNAGSDTSSITTQTPDNVIGETLVVQGRVEFQNLLRIDGHFEGELVGHGSLIIGPTAEVISNLTGLNEVYVEGILIGDCSCNRMQIRFAGCVTGNLQCASLGMDPSVVLKGSANINPSDKPDKSRSKHAASRNRGQSARSQARVTDDSSSKGSTAALSPESVTSSRGQEKHRRRGSGDLGGSGGHRPNAISSDSSSSVVLGDNLPQPPANGSGGDHVVPKMAPGDAAKIPVRTTVAARARPPTHATNPAS
ncbi:unnamed protein product [Pylaiella littoralis]